LTSDGDYSSMPYRTLGIDVTGSFLAGPVPALLTAKRDLSTSLRYLISIGFFGSYAIFSIFAMRHSVLFRKANRPGLAYVEQSVCVGSLAVWGGSSVGHRVIGL
jgi:fluoride ion exporter CrcB/FEX